MKLAGLFLLLAGWLLVVAALILLPNPTSRTGFIIAGFGVEALGLALAFRSHMPVRGHPK